MKTNSKSQFYKSQTDWFGTLDFQIFRLLGMITLIFFCPLIRQELSADLITLEWKELKGEHFLIYYVQDEKFAKEVVDKSEVYYRRIASDLGYPRYDSFWLWDNRVKIYIYPDHASFLKATAQPQWSEGMADFKKKLIAGHVGIEGFLESLLPHEIAHLIFRDFVGFKGEIPLWLDEGVAQWAEEAKRQEMKFKVKKLFESDTLLSLEDIMKLDLRYFSEKTKVYIRSTRTKEGDPGVLIVSGDNLIITYYLQSVSLVGFLTEKYGSERFAEFCRQLREGKKMDEALRFAYPTYIRSLKEFEDRWREYLAQDS